MRENLIRVFPFVLIAMDLIRGNAYRLFEDQAHAYYILESLFYLLMYAGLYIIYDALDESFIWGYAAIMVILPFAFKEFLVDELILNNNTVFDHTDIPMLLVSVFVIYKKWASLKR